MKPVVLTREVVCQADPATVWGLITDTDRLNRLAGMPPVEVKTISEGGAARFLVTTNSFGVELEYEERPFEWVDGERFSILRKVRTGPVQSIEMIFALTPREPSGTTVGLTLTLVPRSALLAPVAKGLGWNALRGLAKAVARVLPGAKQSISSRWTGLPAPDLNVESLRQAAKELSVRAAGAEDLVERLVGLVREGSDAEVSRLRPYALAESWGAERRDVLALCLKAVRSGLLELQWDLVCPSCRTRSSKIASLSELDGEGHCQQCDIRFGVDLDRAVEATFAPPDDVRRYATQTYCVGGPARTPHVVSQVVLPARSERELRAPRTAGRYRLFVRGGTTATVQVEPGAAASSRVRADGAELSPAQLTVAPLGAVVVEWAGEDDRHAKLEYLEWSDQAATAHDLSLLPDFRRQFSKEVLRPGLSLKVGRVAIVFTDLTGSTQLYTRLGDARAFQVVHQHFDLLFGIVHEHRGVIVKTIGDALMAAFPDDAQAVKGTAAMLLAFPGFASRSEHSQDLSVKLGAYAAACYAVNANGRLDYFGQCVNIAARLQAQAGGGELVLTRELADRAEAEGWLSGCGVVERFTAVVKGVDTPIPAARIRVALG